MTPGSLFSGRLLGGGSSPASSSPQYRFIARHATIIRPIPTHTDPITIPGMGGVAAADATVGTVVGLNVGRTVSGVGAPILSVGDVVGLLLGELVG